MTSDKHSDASGLDKAQGGLFRQYGRDILAATLLTLAAALSIVIAMAGESSEPRRAGATVAPSPTHLTQN